MGHYIMPHFYELTINFCRTEYIVQYPRRKYIFNILVNSPETLRKRRVRLGQHCAVLYGNKPYSVVIQHAEAYYGITRIYS